jgi:hypothetical protein
MCLHGFVLGAASSEPLFGRSHRTNVPTCCNDPLRPQPIWAVSWEQVGFGA